MSTTARDRYPSDLTALQWENIEHLFPQARGNIGRPREYPLREIVNAILYLARGGCSWRMLPHDFPPWETIYGYFRRWMRDGTLRRLREMLIRPHRSTAANDLSSAVVRDSHDESPERSELRIWSPGGVSNPERSLGRKPPTAIEPPPDVA